MEAVRNVRRNRNETVSSLGFRRFAVKLKSFFSHQLPFHVNGSVLEIDVLECETSQFADPKTCSEQDYKQIKILCSFVLFVQELKHLLLLGGRHGSPLAGLDKKKIQLEIEWISEQDAVVDSGLKRFMQIAFYPFD